MAQRPTLYNYGSINIDHVYRVPHLVKPGETLASHGYQQVLGGKGANQSLAAARAGGRVAHWGQLNEKDRWALELMDSAGVNITGVDLVEVPSGHAVIQVDDQAENAIVLFGGANQSMDDAFVTHRLSDAVAGQDWLLLQNECSLTADIIQKACAQGLSVAFNPAPMTPEVGSMALEELALLFVNRGEGAALAGLDEHEDAERILDALMARYPSTEIVLTLGGEGAYYQKGTQRLFEPACRVTAVDTTAAGDTFIGYFMATRLAGQSDAACLTRATRAAALSVQKEGAHTSIPSAQDVDTP
ncbi:ribokinase [Larsenimonas rhizosphaerae]|uniref:ribokinase n=1 Tax=Larsenimonas rhizosphaerae TaxID=2944682 RepID=UPI002033996B|nr:ribokinase [Larsenimonas rhizosphaerae]MCM2131378.1 ribokinase [Larsenimonas rhizosphaerae]